MNFTLGGHNISNFEDVIFIKYYQDRNVMFIVRCDGSGNITQEYVNATIDNQDVADQLENGMKFNGNNKEQLEKLFGDVLKDKIKEQIKNGFESNVKNPVLEKVQETKDFAKGVSLLMKGLLSNSSITTKCVSMFEKMKRNSIFTKQNDDRMFDETFTQCDDGLDIDPRKAGLNEMLEDEVDRYVCNSVKVDNITDEHMYDLIRKVLTCEILKNRPLRAKFNSLREEEISEEEFYKNMNISVNMMIAELCAEIRESGGDCTIRDFLLSKFNKNQ